MISLDCDDVFSTWRRQARWLLSHQIDPARVSWALHSAADLFATDEPIPEHQGPFLARIPLALIGLLENAARYRGEQRWSLLYEVLWRVSHGDRTAMLAGDKLGSELHRRIKTVEREAHHLHAFLRFVAVPYQVDRDDNPVSPLSIEPFELPEYVAWHEPAHDILHSASTHFVGRMGQQRWMIATPQDGVYFDGQQLIRHRCCPLGWQHLAQNIDDPSGDLWLTYYSHIFNPARLNPKVLQGHLPVRFWKNLPEGHLIPALISEARNGKQRDGQATNIASKPGKIISLAIDKCIPRQS
ncbi:MULTISPECIES: TIGR03915 family putative DNA repair protein [unclassified Pseudomonas]|uniref:TIGR03915 family putative DNA repair protein n=1 Tax=unclassified Pseudomonas TaxID=196821 RepID=UPI002B235791|nr:MULTISPECIES: TIGR03915 family putative DNA repair protein [unclassified Pseudomonas]MEA9977851.1 TIGR03915 family putative DNA repair protein [Pseudomonas sp. RTS4]MEB0195890.1 TIGR03915 family putative DNA repair protein [Pseudomonas sp. 5S4]MEB0244860.1 TIGR03915 family putative DNA repair protein [Pseudomonas sp. 10S5]